MRVTEIKRAAPAHMKKTTNIRYISGWNLLFLFGTQFRELMIEVFVGFFSILALFVFP